MADVIGLAPFAPFDHPAVVACGLLLVALGITGTLLGQRAMGDAWRGDVDPDARTDFVTSGPFRYVRNPILTATAITAAGIALLAPNAFGGFMLVSVLAAHQVQVRLVEEPHLLRVHGEAYREYAASTGRFVPAIGRLPRDEPKRPQPDRNHDGPALPPTGQGRAT